MPPKKNKGTKPEEPKKNKEKPEEPKKTETICGVRGPGPKYKLKTLVGYKGHCISRLRNPAYSIGYKKNIVYGCEGPGPKYLLPPPKQHGFSFGDAARYSMKHYSPGPKYALPSGPKTPAFTIHWRTPPRGDCGTPGPYYVKPLRDAPAFSFGLRWKSWKCDCGPGPHKRGNLNVIKPKAPAYSIGHVMQGPMRCIGPGPKYKPKAPKPSPAFSFGTRHGPCAPPYITECDEMC